MTLYGIGVITVCVLLFAVGDVAGQWAMRRLLRRGSLEPWYLLGVLECALLVWGGCAAIRWATRLPPAPAMVRVELPAAKPIVASWYLSGGATVRLDGWADAGVPSAPCRTVLFEGGACLPPGRWPMMHMQKMVRVMTDIDLDPAKDEMIVHPPKDDRGP